MGDNTLKSNALAQIDREIAEWSRIVAASEGRQESPGITPEWSLKDLAAHLTGWRVRSLAELEAEARGEPKPPPPWPAELTDEDEINDWIYQENRDRPFADVQAAVESANTRLRSLVESLSEDELADKTRFPSREGKSLGELIASGEFFSHYHEEHEVDVERWIEAGHIHHP